MEKEKNEEKKYKKFKKQGKENNGTVRKENEGINKGTNKNFYIL